MKVVWMMMALINTCMLMSHDYHGGESCRKPSCFLSLSLPTST
jgi:hypothetical protein